MVTSVAAATGGPVTGKNASVTIPPELQKQFPELIDLILKSESMDDEERQYWINILSVMTPEQRENLRGILQSECDQLAAIDAKYQKEVCKLTSEEAIARMGQKRKESRSKREKTEMSAATEEAKVEEDILRKIQEHEP
jgi:hypothetical protein